MGKLSTHVLDTANGKPAQDIKIELYRASDTAQNVLIKTLMTNSDGRTDELLLDASNIEVGEYIIVFHVADYFTSLGLEQTEPAFLNRIPIQFGVFDATQNYHVPLLVSPWSYSTYRGS